MERSRGGFWAGPRAAPREKSEKRVKKQLREMGGLLVFSSATETGAALKVKARALKSGWFLWERKTIFQKTRSLELQSREGGVVKNFTQKQRLNCALRGMRKHPCRTAWEQAGSIWLA